LALGTFFLGDIMIDFIFFIIMLFIAGPVIGVMGYIGYDMYKDLTTRR